MTEIAEERIRAGTNRACDVARAAERGVKADRGKHDRDDGGRRERGASPREGSRAQAKREDGERDGEDDEAAAVRTCLAPADGDQGKRSKWNEPRQAGDRDRRDYRREHQRLELVPDPVEATAAVRARAENSQRVRLGRERQHGEIHTEKERD